MKFTLLRVRVIERLRSMPLERVLNRAWWLIFGIMFVLLAVDGLIFYGFGLGRAPRPPTPTGGDPPRLNEELIRSAASLSAERRMQFQSASSTFANLPNPFR
ncbi:MAG: hypothetical protein HY473_02245 [Candidatus Sungbacteria bacterium]|uniref:Uncharacterized protein n=1 Tax=Candidatus Sungiibacteriota bacterium TaxID=2750080 RepID=A0A933DS04_9BACT|nr:hypothetical protein [Candidatus Sungbacteria bacterium]